MEQDESIALDWSPRGRAGKAALTVRIGSRPVKVCTVKMLEEDDRARFKASLQKEFPALQEPEMEAELDRQLLEMAAAIAQHLGGDGNGGLNETAPTQGFDTRELLDATPEDVRAEAEALLKDPNLIRRVLEDVFALGVAGECELVASVYLVGTSRLLEQPLAAIVQGPTSSGKSYAIRKTADLFPPEAVVHATHITPQALYYMSPGSLVHRFIVAGERSRLENDETAEATRALREMLSEQRLSKLIPIKSGDRMETLRIEQEGPIAYVESTTLTKIFDEDLNRCILLATDERPEQTRRILSKIAEGRAARSRELDKAHIIEVHRTVQRMLGVVQVVIPYVKRLADEFGAEHVEARRAFSHLLRMIEAVATLYQRQRTTNSTGCIVADIEDYRLTRHLLAKPLARLLGGRVSDAALRLHDRLRRRGLPDAFTAKDIAKGEPLGERSVRNYLNELSEAGFVELVEPGRGPKPHTWRLSENPPDPGDWAGLPDVERIEPGGDFRVSDKAQVSFAQSLGGEAS